MGGHIVAYVQVTHGSFAAICALGASFTQTRLAMLPGKRWPFRGLPMNDLYLAMADLDMAATFHWPDEPEWVVAADMDTQNLPRWRSATIPACAMELIQPLVVARQAEAARVPVLLVYGEVDVTPEPLVDLTVFRSTRDLSMLLVPAMARMHNFAATRHQVWTRLEVFAQQVLAQSQV
jgi:hypothetical protein